MTPAKNRQEKQEENTMKLSTLPMVTSRTTSRSLLISMLTLTLGFTVVSNAHGKSKNGGKHNAQQMFDNQMQAVLSPYLAIHASLAADKTTQVAANAKLIIGLATVLKSTSKILTGKHAEHYKDIPKNIISAAEILQKAKDIKTMRDAYKKLSMPMAMWGSMSKPTGVKVMFCSMARGSWLQKSANVQNPYFGAEMLSCGEVIGGGTLADNPSDAKGKHNGHAITGHHGH